jgi:A/G-specific adenine glycosylase
MMKMTNNLLLWYNSNARDLPWRQNPNPFYIYLSEIILQQTRIEQGLAYYHRFIERFPTITDLANAEQEEVLKLWQGLGYYSRARNLFKAAQIIRDSNRGTFPTTYKALLKLPGVGPYTAAAIASTAFGEVVPAVDGNVKRVVARFFSLTDSIDDTATTRQISTLLDQYISKKEPGNFNQAMMDLGALICKPRNPLCSECPIAEQCIAHKENRTSELPVRTKKTKVRSRFFYYFVVIQNNHTVLNERTDKDIWQGLYEFPLLESEMQLTEEQVINYLKKHYLNDQKKVSTISFTAPVKHILSHQIIMAQFIIVKSASNFVISLPTPLQDVSKYPVSRLVDRFIQSSGLF